MRKNQILYNPEYSPAEDHELWVRLSDFGKFQNLPQSLLQYRIHGQNISLKKRSLEQDQKLKDAQIRYIIKFFASVNLATNEIELLHALFFRESDFDFSLLDGIERVIGKIISRHYQYPVPEDQLHSVLIKRFHYCCTISTHIGISVYQLANRNKLMRSPIIGKVKLLIKSILKYKRSE